MSRTAKTTCIGIAIIASAVCVLAQSSTSKSSASSFTIVFKDGHQKTFSTADVTRIEFKNPGTIVLMRGGREESLAVSEIARIEFSSSASSAFQVGRNHFLGKWRVGDGAGNDFYITLDRSGQATKSIGGSHGTWEVVDGEARITWDDGWHDAIRQVGTKHEKVAYEPGKSFNDEPNNVTDARRVDAQPI